MRTKLKTSFALSAEAMRLLRAMADRMGVSVSAAVEVIIRDRAKAEKVK